MIWVIIMAKVFFTIGLLQYHTEYIPRPFFRISAQTQAPNRTALLRPRPWAGSSWLTWMEISM